ncbi:MAG TPA: ATP synthase F1 subunit epsilon [Candidatus Limnocylindrales bacterium]|jgi:F-type H+-transporting ATPase subunit epsilon|nr:ATP synthase F1 subunit epsilon [Candidatus Limnocylindrales bacterium]
MRLRIITPLRPVVDAEVSDFVAPGTEGEFGVLPQHVAFLGSLKPGIVTYVEDGTRKRVVISGGYAEVRQDVITVLADDAQLPEEVDVEAARADAARVQEELSRGAESAEVTERLLRELALAEARSSASTR